ncbi:craniofacial development protein 2-like [Penaeus monodon]|uniref:craniofacial development protein 2-like n=1 Tax=Penaeus monodon TaxID=6687 RepID=UPI0018A6F4F9|nr:craniofacial development protein 2-like [Penaeus monodon]
MDMYTFSNEANTVKGIPVNDSESSLGICETRWTGSGEFNSDSFKVLYSGEVYAPTTASSEEEIDEFYNTLEKAKTQCKSTDVTVIMGDLNAKVGNEAEGETVGKFGLGTQNERGEKWVQWCKTNEYVLTNTWYEQHPRRLWTWLNPGSDFKNQIDYIAIKKRYRSAIKNSKAYPGADCGSDHNPFICELKIKNGNKIN